MRSREIAGAATGYAATTGSVPIWRVRFTSRECVLEILKIDPGLAGPARQVAVFCASGPGGLEVRLRPVLLNEYSEVWEPPNIASGGQ